jgi:hypothetical protein
MGWQVDFHCGNASSVTVWAWILQRQRWGWSPSNRWVKPTSIVSIFREILHYWRSIEGTCRKEINQESKHVRHPSQASKVIQWPSWWNWPVPFHWHWGCGQRPSVVVGAPFNVPLSFTNGIVLFEHSWFVFHWPLSKYLSNCMLQLSWCQMRFWPWMSYPLTCAQPPLCGIHLSAFMPWKLERA